MAHPRWLMALALAAGPLALAGCFDEPPVEVGVPVFGDRFDDGISPNPFDTSVLTALTVDGAKAYSGSSSIRLDVPAQAAGYCGGAVLSAAPQDLSAANALVFWATASRDATWGRLGFGLNFDPLPSTYQTTVFDLPLTTTWERHLIPIPDPSLLTAEHGMLWYVDTEATGYSAWLDDVRFDRVDPSVINFSPSLVSDTGPLLVGGTVKVPLAATYTDFDGTERSLDSIDAAGSGPAPGFFTFSSTNPSVARVDAAGQVTGLAVGQAVVTARLAGALLPGELTVDVVTTAPVQPAVAAPAPPARAAADVVSLYNSGHVYADRAVDTWQTSWSSSGAPGTFAIPGTSSTVKKYTGLVFAGVEFLTPGPHVNASGMTTLHLDVWTPNAAGLGVKLVGWNGTVASTGEAQVDLGSSVVRKYRWNSIEIPLSRFPGVDLANIGQIVWVNPTPSPGTNGTFFVDNVYFHK